MVTKTYTDAKELTRDMWSQSSKEEKLKILKSVDANDSWAVTQSVTEMATRGGGIVLNAIKDLNEQLIKNNGGKVTITWKD